MKRLLKPIKVLKYRDHLTEAQDASLRALCAAFHVEYNPDHYTPKLQFPPEYVAGWIGGVAVQFERRTAYVNVSPEGVADI